MSRLLTAIQEEISIFKHFNSFKSFSVDTISFMNPDSNEVPHWDLTYQKSDLGKTDYSREFLESAYAFYSKHGRSGNIAMFSEPFKDHSIAREQYFVLENPNSNDVIANPNFKEYTSPTNDHLDQFCEIINKAFSLSPATAKYFRNKMEVMFKSTECKFWIVDIDKKPSAVGSTFKTELGDYFLFNFAVLPELQGQKLGSDLMRHICAKHDRRIYTYSPTVQMQKSILPNAGFEFLGEMHLVPIKKMIELSGRPA